MKLSDLISDERYQRLPSLIRFNGTPRIHNECVDAHSFWVQFFAGLVFDSVIPMNPDWEYMQQLYHKDLKIAVLENSTVHDFPEMFTGDVLFDLKYNNFNGGAIKELIEKYEKHLILTSFNEGGITELMKMRMKRYFEPTSRLANCFVKIGDWLACLMYEYKELMLGNRYFQHRIFETSLKGLHKSGGDCMEALDELYPYSPTDIKYQFLIDEIMTFNLPNPNVYGND
jgi:5'-deoxynucleotidase YfbR-like HD superfamily hydrolase